MHLKVTDEGACDAGVVSLVTEQRVRFQTPGTLKLVGSIVGLDKKYETNLKVFT